MSLSRRRFTPEFKLSAVERLEQGASAAEVSRAFEVNPNLLHRWRREFRQGPANAFPGEGQAPLGGNTHGRAGAQGRPTDHGDRFFKGVLAAHRTTAEAAGIGWKAAVGQQILPTSPGETADDDPTDVPAHGAVARDLLPFAASQAEARSGPGTARRHPAHRRGVPQLRTAAHHRRIAAARLGDQSQEGVPHSAGRQPAVPAATEVRADHRLGSRSCESIPI